MPYGFGSSSVFTSSAGGDIGGGRRYTRLLGPLLVGQVNDNAGGTVGVPLQAPHLANVSTMLSDVLLPAPGQFITTAPTVGLLYISQTTATLVPGAAPTPGITGMAAIAWNSGDKTLEVFSTVTGAWMRLHSTAGGNLVFSSS